MDGPGRLIWPTRPAQRVRFGPGVDVRELALESYAQQVRELVREGITAAVASKNYPLLSVTNRYEPYVSTDGVEGQTVRPIIRLTKSHLNAAILLSDDGYRSSSCGPLRSTPTRLRRAHYSR
jgi:hypothetical protein